MKILKIEGNHPLTGSVRIGGAKNSAVALIPAAILSSEPITLTNVPNISDIDDLVNILDKLNVKVKRASESLIIDASNFNNVLVPKELSSKLRASYYFMSSILARDKHVSMYFPGGCKIGARPIDQTLKVFRALGAKVEETSDCLFNIEAKELKGADIRLDMPSVGATVNAIIVASMANGETNIFNAAKEPEIVDVADMLNDMGAKISGAGTSTITIEGVEKLGGCCHNIIPDRIEAGTYTILGSMIGTCFKVDNIIPEHIKSLTDKLEEAGVDLEIKEDYIMVNSNNKKKMVNIETSGYPGFPTDLQQPMVSFLTLCKGSGTVNETIYENRYMNVPYLNKMGANIHVDGRIATILGPTKLIGKEVVATDLRAGASLLLAALVAKGKTTITDAHHILRGYEDLVDKLCNVGANIELIDKE